MSSARRPGLWSYLSFSGMHTRRRSVSTTLPTKQNDRDPLEKPGRYSTGRYNGSSGSVKDIQMAWLARMQRPKYLKTGGILLFVVILFLFFTSGDRDRVRSYVGSHSSYATCTRPYDSTKPLKQYALMIDAGSTGSRIHVYRFNNCGPTPQLESEIFEQTPVKKGGSGLSSYDSDAEGAAKSLDVLLDVAMKHVPDSDKSCTPIAVKATAGLRKLGPEKSEATLQAVRKRLETVYPFPVVSEEKGGVEVMDGKDEGVYAWITANYLLGKIGGPENTPTAAVFDLGGGSTQIVFQPTFAMPETLADGDHKYALTFGGRDFTLYQHSYLGYGLMEARNSINSLLVDSLYNSGRGKDFIKNPITNPCIAPGYTKEVDIFLNATHPLGETFKVNMTGPDAGAPIECRAIAKKSLKKDAVCELAPCSFGGVHQPSLAKTFATEDIYLFSYFYERTDPLGMPSAFTLEELERLAGHVCDGESSWGRFKPIEGALEELRDRPDHCLDLNFMLALLHTGYEIPMKRQVKIAKKIGGNELGWCLGASLPLLSQESGWTCKIKQIS